MKIVTWNINSVRLRLALLNRLVNEEQPDIIALQETKVVDDLFPHEQIRAIGYPYLFYSGSKSYNGVAVISKIKPEISFPLKFYNDDKRHLAVKFRDIELHNFYVPAGGDIPDVDENPKFKHKLEYIALIQNWLTQNRHAQDKIVLLGDLNIAPLEHDVWSSRQLRNVVSHTDIERAALLDLQNSVNFIDSARYYTPPEQKFYTWWSYRNQDWQKSNRGRRLDHIWVTPPLQERLHAIKVLRDARDWPQPSDHVPYILELAG